MKSQKTKTSEEIIRYLQKNGKATGNELAYYLKITPRAVRKQLRNLHENGSVVKVGRPPKVFYELNDKHLDENQLQLFINKKLSKTINERYLYISPKGEELVGLTGFLEWCKKTQQDPPKTAVEYIKTLQKYDRFKKNGLVDGYSKIKNTFDKVYLDALFYLDFYSIERFGKTKLGQLLLYAKQSQNRHLINKLSAQIQPQVEKVIKSYAIDGVLFIPPTVKREVQFMFELEKQLEINVRHLKVAKAKTPIIIPQKTLSKLQDRISNASHTIVVEDTSTYSNILLLDDAVGSGATMNEVARQIRNKEICSGKIIGLAITGSFKGFDVISEV